MKKVFIDYLRAIGITEPLQERAKTIYEFFEEICPDEITDVFVSEYLTKDGSRKYTDIRFLSEKYTMFAMNFINKDDFRMGNIRNVRNFILLKKDYDFKKANEKSRMSIRVLYIDGKKSTYKASGMNCDSLKEIFLKYIIPNLKI